MLDYCLCVIINHVSNYSYQCICPSYFGFFIFSRLRLSSIPEHHTQVDQIAARKRAKVRKANSSKVAFGRWLRISDINRADAEFNSESAQICLRVSWALAARQLAQRTPIEPKTTTCEQSKTLQRVFGPETSISNKVFHLNFHHKTPRQERAALRKFDIRITNGGN